MKQAIQSHSRERLEMVRWAARIGAVTAESLARLDATSVASARGRLRAAERARLLSSSRVLSGQPALFTVTRAGLRAVALHGFEPTRVSAANSLHAIACADAAAALARAFPDHVVGGERELRRDERAHECLLASVSIAGVGPGTQLHRPDLVLWPRGARELPVAVEVELTVKSPRRLLEICTAWSRCRHVSGVLYLVAADVKLPLARALARTQASAQIVLVDLDALLEPDGAVASELHHISNPVAVGA